MTSGKIAYVLATVKALDLLFHEELDAARVLSACIKSVAGDEDLAAHVMVQDYQLMDMAARTHPEAHLSSSEERSMRALGTSRVLFSMLGNSSERNLGEVLSELVESNSDLLMTNSESVDFDVVISVQRTDPFDFISAGRSLWNEGSSMTSNVSLRWDEVGRYSPVKDDFVLLHTAQRLREESELGVFVFALNGPDDADTWRMLTEQDREFSSLLMDELTASHRVHNSVRV